ncbi:MAG: hypothetical protein ACI9PP_002346 [Halobacteriales archaeon]|jgi:hypothetical protein
MSIERADSGESTTDAHRVDGSRSKIEITGLGTENVSEYLRESVDESREVGIEHRGGRTYVVVG